MANMRNVNWVKLRRGLFEHLEKGWMSSFDGWVFLSILKSADFRTGCFEGTWETVKAGMPKDIVEGRKEVIGSIQHKIYSSLGRLEKRRYIAKVATHFVTKRVTKGLTIWVNKYETPGDQFLNAIKTVACGKPVYYVLNEDGTFDQPRDESLDELNHEGGNEPTTKPRRKGDERVTKSVGFNSSDLEEAPDAKNLELENLNLRTERTERSTVQGQASPSVQKQSQNQNPHVQSILDRLCQIADKQQAEKKA